ncbi:hypothetical protein bcgnr5390_24920 [Bacillus luti]
MLFRVEDAEIYYEIVGEEKPVIIIHGCAPDHRLMMKCIEAVFQKYEGYKRIYRLIYLEWENRMLQIG